MTLKHNLKDFAEILDNPCDYEHQINYIKEFIEELEQRKREAEKIESEYGDYACSDLIDEILGKQQ